MTKTDPHSKTEFESGTRVQLVDSHPQHRQEVKNNTGKKGYISSGSSLGSDTEVLVKFDKNSADEGGDLLWINPKWLDRCDPPTPIEDPDREPGELTPGCYILSSPYDYPRFIAVSPDNTVQVRSTIETKEFRDITVSYMESWLRDHWTEQKVACEDTPFEQSEISSLC